MKYLLDTHTFLWWLFDDPRLIDDVRRKIGDPGNEVFVSSASVWEIATKFRLGKLPEAAEVAGDVPAWIEKAQFTPLSITVAHAQLAGSWKLHHRDPFDRMLAAQAKILEMPLITSDKAFDLFGIEILW
jgi:PIN domain nuclease of toxin-antitoxin system